MYLARKHKKGLGGDMQTLHKCQSLTTKTPSGFSSGYSSCSSILRQVRTILVTKMIPLIHMFAVRQPLEKVDPHHDFDVFEGILYTMALAFSFEGMSEVIPLAHKPLKT